MKQLYRLIILIKCILNYSSIQTRYAVLFCFFLLFLSSHHPLYAQQTITGIPWSGPKGITLTVHEIMSMQDNSKVTHYKVPREHETHLHKRNNPDAPLVSAFPEGTRDGQSNGSGNSITATQTIGSSFLASALNVAGFIPPDCNGAAGPTQILTVANGRIRVYSKTGVLGALNATNDVFFNSVRNGSGISDCHIRYDRLTQRWIVIGINVASSNNRVVIAVSSGPTITGAASFTFFYFQSNLAPPAGDNGSFLDYPTLGVDANALYIGGVRFNPNTFSGCPIFVVRKSSVLGAGPIVVTAFRTVGGTTTGIYVPQGVDNDDPTATQGYFIGTDAGVYSLLNIIRVNSPGGVPSITNLTPLVVPANNAPLLQVHLGAAANRRLDGLDDRLFAAHVMKNKLNGVTTLWTAHNTVVNSSGVASGTMNRNAARWYEIGNLSTASPTLVQSGTLFDNAASNPRGFWNASVAMSGQGHVVLGSSTAGTNFRADVAVAGRYSSDPVGTMQPFALATASSTAYNVQAADGQRWGDYSQVVVDPNDNMTMWTFQEYCDATNSWGLRIVQMIAPAPPPTASLTPLAPVGITPAVAVNIVATSTPNNTGFFDPGTDAGGPGFSNHITASANGSITVNSITFVDATHVNLSLNTSAAVPGIYTITITNPDGQTTTIPITVYNSLPVELLSFSATATEKNVLLDWTTATEINNDFFTVQKSLDSKFFEDAGRVSGTGNSTTVRNYSFADEFPFAGLSYYRLRQTDYDGTISLSDLVPVHFGKEVFGLTGIFPDYENQEIQIYLSDNTSEQVKYYLIDVLGKTVAEGFYSATKGTTHFVINGAQLERGVYWLTLSNEKNKLTRKIFY